MDNPSLVRDVARLIAPTDAEIDVMLDREDLVDDNTALNAENILLQGQFYAQGEQIKAQNKKMKKMQSQIESQSKEIKKLRRYREESRLQGEEIVRQRAEINELLGFREESRRQGEEIVRQRAEINELRGVREEVQELRQIVRILVTHIQEQDQLIQLGPPLPITPP